MSNMKKCFVLLLVMLCCFTLTAYATETEVTAQTEAATETAEPLVLGTYEDGTSPELSGVELRLTIDAGEIIIAMYQNTAVDALLERLPMEDLSFFDLSGIEKPIEAPEEPISLGEEEPGYDPTTGEMVIYRPWGNFTIFYGDFRYSAELVPLGIVTSGLDILAAQTEDFTGVLSLVEPEAESDAEPEAE